jgi:hypothetical protein
MEARVTRKMVMRTIVADVDRALFYGDSEEYHVIGTMADANRLKVGETISYELYGVNVGWLLSDDQL